MLIAKLSSALVFGRELRLLLVPAMIATREQSGEMPTG